MAKQDTFKGLGMLILLGCVLFLPACAETVTVTVPPRVDLKAFPTIGVIDFEALSPGELEQEATQKFLGNLQGAQPGVRLLELGRRQEVLRQIGRSELDYQAIRALGEKFGVAGVLSGTIEMSEPRPDLKIAPSLTSVSAQAKIDGKMSAKLWETASGATVWTNSSWGSWSVGGVSLSGAGMPRADFSNPREKRNEILMALVKALNGDFWPTYEKRRVQD